MAPRNYTSVELAERTLLTALLHEPDGRRAEDICACLAAHFFRNNLHAIVFSCLQDLRRAPPAEIREHLPALLTRRGFPDLSLEEFFSAPTPDSEAIAAARCILERARERTETASGE